MLKAFPKKGKERERESGQSLVELMISAAILCFIGAMTQQYFQRLDRWEKESLARARVQDETVMWINTIERDLRLREKPKTGEMTAPTGHADIHTYIDRLTPYRNQPGEGLMTAHYYTYCQTVSSAYKARYQSGGDQLNFSASALAARYGSNHPYTCMAMKNCTGDTYPQIVLTLYNHQDKKLPVYPMGGVEHDGLFRAVLPQLGNFRSPSDRIVAAAYCYIPGSGDTDRFIVETAFLADDRATRIIRKEVLFPRENMARIQMLP